MKYPNAGDLQRQTGVDLTSNPKDNPWEVRSSDGGLEGAFADEDDAKFYADELRRTGARGIQVSKRSRQMPSPSREARANPPRVWREKWGDSSEIVIESNRYGYTAWLESKRGGGRLPISFGTDNPTNAQEAMISAKKFLRAVHGRNNPPNVLPVPGQRIRSWDHGDGQLVKICEEGNDGSFLATIKLDRGRTVAVPLTRTEYDLAPRKGLERRTGFSRHEQFIGPPHPDRMPRGTPTVFDDHDHDTVRETVTTQHRVTPGRRNPDDEYPFDTDILDGMARAIWVTSWADWWDELSKEERRERDVPISMSGRDFSDEAPETPDSAVRAAEDLYLLVKRANGKSPGELFEKACQADGCKQTERNAELFGHYLAMQSMDHGVSWFDDHKEFPLRFPRFFEAHYDDGEVYWSPQVKSRENPCGGSR